MNSDDTTVDVLLLRHGESEFLTVLDQTQRKWTSGWGRTAGSERYQLAGGMSVTQPSFLADAQASTHVSLKTITRGDASIHW